MEQELREEEQVLNPCLEEKYQSCRESGALKMTKDYEHELLLAQICKALPSGLRVLA